MGHDFFRRFSDGVMTFFGRFSNGVMTFSTGFPAVNKSYDPLENQKIKFMTLSENQLKTFMTLSENRPKNQDPALQKRSKKVLTPS